MVARRRRFALLLAGLLSVACACSASAQREDSTSLTGAARMSLDGSTILQPGTSHRASLGGEYVRFVSEHWQLGLAPSVGASTSMVSIYGRSSLAGIANYVTGTGNLRWYAGGYASAAENAQQGQFGVVGAQVGALYLLSPLAAFRGELTWRTPTRAGSVASWQFIAFLDPYLPATGSGRVSLPSDAAVDVTGYVYGYASSAVSYEQGADLRIAPFIGVRWAQVGLELTSINSNFSGVKSGSNEIVGFTRLYAPVSARAEPFLEVFGTTPTVRQPTTGGSKLSNFGGSAGLRHYVTNGSAIDVGTTWRWYARTGVDNAGSGRAHDVSLQVRLVTQIRYLAGPL